MRRLSSVNDQLQAHTEYRHSYRHNSISIRMCIMEIATLSVLSKSLHYFSHSFYRGQRCNCSKENSKIVILFSLGSYLPVTDICLHGHGRGRQERDIAGSLESDPDPDSDCDVRHFLLPG